MPDLTLIAALAQNRAIGRANALPWRLPLDFKRFKAQTMGKPVLMGRKTAQSLGRALPGRLNLVLTRSGQAPFRDMVAVGSVEEALIRVGDAPEVMVLGGEEIYILLLPYANKLMLTWVQAAPSNADAFFPEVDFSQWREVFREDVPHLENHDHAFSFVDYERDVPP